MSIKTILIPNIGDVDEVEVVEVLVSVGDSIAVEDSLITVETDKASMEIPSSDAGVIKSITVSVGDMVKEGDGSLRLSWLMLLTRRVLNQHPLPRLLQK